MRYTFLLDLLLIPLGFTGQSFNANIKIYIINKLRNESNLYYKITAEMEEAISGILMQYCNYIPLE